MPEDAFDVFLSYSHEDESLRRELEERLRREELVGTWRARRITGGEEWRGWVDGDLISADLILLLVSKPFLASEYCQGAEVKHALARHASEDAKVIPIIVRPCDWREEPFAELTTLPQGVGPVTEWHSHDEAWEHVAQGIREAADRLRAARGAAPLPSREQTGEYRIAMMGPRRKVEEPSEGSKDEGGPGSSRLAALAGVAAVLVAAFAVWYFAGWRSEEPEEGGAPAVAEATRAEPGPVAAAAERPAGTAAIPAPPPPPAARRPAAGEVPEATPEALPSDRAGLGDQPPEEAPIPATGLVPSEPAAGEPAPAAETEAEPGSAAGPEIDPGQLQDLSRSLGILAAAGAEGDGECLAVLVGDDRALTSRACAQSSSVVVMGGNALTATRDQIFDLGPWQSSGASEIGIVELLQGIGDGYGLAATRFAESFEYQSLDAYYVGSSEIQPVDCAAQPDLAEWDGSGRAYVEDLTFDRYVVFVEAAAEEVIEVAGSQWAALLPEMISSAGESLGGFVCELRRRPPGNVAFFAGGRVVGIGYPCEPFDRLTPEVRDSLPTEVGDLDLDCIASLAEIRDDLRDAQAGLAP